MNEHRYFAHLAESALSAGRPLGPELAEACRAYRHKPPRVREAIEHANEGHLGLAMERLRLDPLVAAVAHLRPAATADVSRRLRDLPGTWDLATPVLLPALYMVGLLLLQLGISLYVSLAIFPKLPGTRPWAVVTTVSAILGALLLGCSFALLWTQSRTAATGGIPGLVLRHVRAARLCTAAGVLVRHGVAPTEAIERLAGSARVSEVDARALIGETGPIDVAALETLASWLAGEGTRRARRIAIRLKTIGGAALVVAGVLTVYATYRGIGSESRALMGTMPW